MNPVLILLFALIPTYLATDPQCVNPNGYNRDSKDCGKYFVCVNGISLGSFSCADGLAFNNELNVCDYANNVKCDGSAPSNPGSNNQGSASTSMPSSSASSASTSGSSQTQSQWTEPSSTENQWEWHPPIGTTTTAEPLPMQPTDQNQYKVVCYYSNWSFYRPKDGKYIPEDINCNLCTHIIFGFVVLNYNSLTLQIHDSWSDVDNQFFKRFVGMKKQCPNLKALVAIGGWNDSAGDKYSKMVSNADSRSRFIQSVMDFLDKYKFDGLDLDWEYPVCWQTDCDKGSKADKQAFGNLIKELRERFEPKGYMLTAAVSPSKKVIEYAYDVPTMAKYLDFINLMSYDYHGSWDSFAQHHAPLYPRPESKSFDPNDEYFNLNYTVNFWIQSGMPSGKICAGMPLYGRSVHIIDPSEINNKYHGYGAKMKGPGKSGEYSREPGFLAYYEICDRIKSGEFKKYVEPYSGPYAVNDQDLVSYDDIPSLLRKAEFIKRMNLGGGMIWVLDLDDFTGTHCCGIKYVLLKAINQGLRGIQFFDPSVDCP